LSNEQQRALVDWIHWGGQLLVSGPESLDTLRGSFLEPYLPVRGGKAVELVGEDLALINDQWTEPIAVFRKRPLTPVRPWSAVTLDLPDDGAPVDVLVSSPQGKPLVVEGRVGRGRVVVTAFRLRERDLVNWPGFDGFLNGCLLRRPPREFSKRGDFRELHVEWWNAGEWQTDTRMRLDPRAVTRVRMFSRDAGYQYRPPLKTEFGDYGQMIQQGDEDAPAAPGIGGWDDFNAVSSAARETIREAAGIEIPDASFVVWVLAAYLVILVPFNWMVFRLIGRIEWAWVVAPLIAVACAGFVIKLAQLDIGFARSNTEISVIELQGAYPRAHVTRFSALYTSLSTPYRVDCDNPAVLVQPFAVDATYAQPIGTVPDDVEYNRAAEVTLSGFRVLSNRTGLLHSEQVVDLAGGISLASDADAVRARVLNATDLELQQAVLLRRNSQNDVEFAWVGAMGAGSAADGVFEPTSGERLRALWLNGSQQDADEGMALNLDRLVTVALNAEEMADGDVRLVAVAGDADLPGMAISPSAPQKRSAALVLANIHYGPTARPHPDKNSSRQFAKKPLEVSEERENGAP
jgi:hypothetical protein